MEILIGGLASVFFQIVAVVAGVLAYRLIMLDDKTNKKARDRYAGLRSVISGKALVRADRLPDGIVRAGMVLNLEKNRIEPNGKLSNDFVDHVAGC